MIIRHKFHYQMSFDICNLLVCLDVMPHRSCQEKK